MNLKLAFCGRTYHLCQLVVPVMGVNEDTKMVCVKVGAELVWVPAVDLLGRK